MNFPIVSVLMPVYNAEAYVEEAIESVLAQTFTDFEFCILDNHSSDGSLSIISRYLSDPRIRLFKNEMTLPIYENFMAVYRNSNPRTKWVKYSLADDILLPRCLEEMIRVGEKSENIGLISSLIQILFPDHRLETRHYGLDPSKEVFYGPTILKQHLLSQISVISSPHNNMYQRAAFATANGYRTKFLHADTELAYRLLDKHRFGFVHVPLSITRFHAATASSFALWYGTNFLEMADFGLVNLHEYENLHLEISEIRAIRKSLVDAIAHNLLRLFAHFEFAAVSEILLALPNVLYPYVLAQLPIAAFSRLLSHLMGLDGGKPLVVPHHKRPRRGTKRLYK